MSSLLRRIERSVTRDEKGKLVSRRRKSGKVGHYMGRGSKLGVVNPKDPCRIRLAGSARLLAKKARAPINRQDAPKSKVDVSAPKKPKLTRAQRRQVHKGKMRYKRMLRRGKA